MRTTTPFVDKCIAFVAILFLSLSAVTIHAQQFDVALTKTTVTLEPVKYGTPIPFNLTIYNQGTDTIMNVELIDHYGDGYDYQQVFNPDWTPHSTISNAVVSTFTEKIPPGEFRIVTVNLLAQAGDSVDDWINTAEVVDFTDRFGVSQEAADLDSQGDEDPDNDAGGLLGSPADDALNGNGMGTPNSGDASTDEDDHDRDTIQIFDLALTKVLDPITGYKYGDTLTFTTTVYNQGNVNTEIVRVRDIVPEGYINPVDVNTANGWSNSAANPVYTFLEIPPFSQVEVELQLILDPNMVNGEAWANYAEIISARDADGPLGSGQDADSQMASNTDGERDVEEGDAADNQILNTPIIDATNPEQNLDQDDHDPAEPVVFDLALIKERTTALASFNYGTPIDYTYTVVNQGNQSATDIVLVDSLPCGAMFETALNPDWSYDPITNLATRTIPGPLDPAESIQETLVLTVIACFEDQETAWTNYMEITQATTVDGVQTSEIDGEFDIDFSNDAGGVPLTDSDNSLTGIGIDDEDNHDVELLQVYDLALKKELITQGPYVEGQDIDFRIRVYNQGNIVIEDLVVEDFIPEGFGYDPAVNAPFGWTTSYSTLVGGVPTTFPDTLNVMEDIFLVTEDSVDIMLRLTLELDGTEITDWYNYAHIWVATDTLGNNRFDDADSNPFTSTAEELGVIPGSAEDDNIFSPGKSVSPQVEEDDHDVANIDFFDLSLTKTATSTPSAYGETVTFDIVVRNEGVQFAHDITVVDYLPCGLTFSSSPGWVLNGTTGNPEYFYTDTLYAGEEVTIPISLTVEECLTIDADSYRNEAEIVNALNDDDVPGDDQDSTPDDDPDNDTPDEDDTDDALVSVFDLSLIKTLTTPPANFMVGTQVVYDIVITNEGNTIAVNTEVTDYLPCGLSFSPTGNTGWSQDIITGNISYVEMSQIMPGSSVTIPLILAIAECTNEPTNLDNLIEISDDNDPNGPIDDFDSTPDNGDPNEDDIDDAPLAYFDLSLSKTMTTNTTMLNYGMDINYTIEVTNEGSIPATSFTVTDRIPCGLSFSSVGNAGWVLDTNTGDASFDYNTSLNSGESVQLILTLTLEECANPSVDSWNNVAEISDATDPNGPANDEDSTPNNNDPNEDDQDNAPLEVGDLAISKSHQTPMSPVGIGTTVDYSITVTNQGNVSMVDFVVIDYIPCGLSFSTVGNTGWLAAGGNAEFTVTTPLSPGASTVIPLTLTIADCLPPTTPDYVNATEISDQGPNPDDPDSTPDDDPDNDPPNEDDNDDDPLEWYDLSLTKTSNFNGDVRYGDLITFTMTVTNEGSLPATDVEVTDYLPCGLRFESASNPDWSYNSITGNASSTFSGTIAPRESRDFTLLLVVEPCNNINATSYRNVAEISGGDDPSGNPGDDEDSTPDNNPNNDPPNEDDIDDEPIVVFDLSLTKSLTSTQVEYEIGDEVVYNITVSNEGNLSATGIEITDYIPCGMSLSGSNTLVWNVGPNGYASHIYTGTILPGNSQSFEIRLLIEDCTIETGERRNVAEISDNGPNSPEDADSTPDDNPDNDPDDEDDNDDTTIDVNIGSTLGDYVWNDTDGDGIQDGYESGIEGVTVSLYNSDGNVIATTTTNSTGFYEFTEIEEGDYYIGFTDLPENLEPTIPFAGDEDNDSNVTNDHGDNTTNIFGVTSGEDDFTIDAGFFVCSEIKGVSFYDINEDDIRQTTENGINGLVVNLYRRVNGVWTLWESETTHHDYDTPSDDGIWDFCVAPGQYYVEVVMPPIGLVRVRPFVGGSNFDSDIHGANGPNTTPSFTLSPEGSKTDLGAGYYPMATVGNRVWMDENHNGIQETNEAKVAGVKVQVYNMEHELVDEAITNEEGIYKVDYLLKETYYLKFEAPAGYGFTFANASDDSIDSDVNHEMGANTTSPRFFNPGDDVINIDAGIVNGVLPLTWGDVYVTKVDDRHLIEWSTEQELNVSHFEIELSHDGITNFTTISKVDAVGNSPGTNDYSTSNKELSKAGQYYYRIKEVGINGEYSYSKIVFISENSEVIGIFPNPTAEKITINGLDIAEQPTSIKIIDSSGKVVLDNSRMTSNSIDLSNLPNGIYTIVIERNETVIEQRRIIKL